MAEIVEVFEECSVDSDGLLNIVFRTEEPEPMLHRIRFKFPRIFRLIKERRAELSV